VGECLPEEAALEHLTNEERELMDWLTTVDRDSLPKPPLWSEITRRMGSADSVEEAMAAESPRLVEIGYLYYAEEAKRRARPVGRL
jgi:hypothetical protein